MLAGSVLCMTSVAETCGFKINLRPVKALCLLAVSVPYHEIDNDNGALNGRLVLACADVSV